ncbi:AraC family transcriptional regulator [Paraburkholderia sediminicola]|uniref:AraC family transcriptional regulator n=1 Tax=Paraburkholderia metrosideri TaxID=580937 RepID=A0ABW9E3Q9_9BURK
MTYPSTPGPLHTIGPGGRRDIWLPPAEWKKRPIGPTGVAVTIEHYIACASEVTDLETTCVSLAMFLQPPKALQVRLDGTGWVSKSLRGPLSYTSPDFLFSIRWSEDIEWLTIYFDPSWLDKCGLKESLAATSIAPRFGICDDLLMQIVRSIHQDAVTGTPLGPTYAEALGAAAVHRMQFLESGRQPRQYVQSTLMEKAVEYIQDNFRERLTLQTLVDAIDYPGDLCSFIRSFKKCKGLSPHQYIVEKRLHVARDLITQGRRGVTEVALDCGFSSVSHFSAAFRKRWDVSPSELKPRPAIATREEETISIDR